MHLSYNSAYLGEKIKISYGLWRVKGIGKHIELLKEAGGNPFGGEFSGGNFRRTTTEPSN